MEKLGAERGAVQDPLVKYATEIGWNYISQEECEKLRGGKTGLILKEILKNQLLKLNNFINEEQIEDLIKKLEKLPVNIEGNLQAWEYFKGLKTIFIKKENREKNINFIDNLNLKNNIFQVTDEFEFFNGSYTNRYDVVFLINGIPLFFVETKSATKFGGMEEALEQVRRYHRETPEALALFQIYTITHILRFLYSGTWPSNLSSFFDWKTESKVKNFEYLVKSFFDKERVIDILFNYILFTKQDETLKKVVLRPHQIRAVNKIVARASDKDKKRALIWHTQGSGKTFTMIVAAKKILENKLFENPLVIMLVDRNELETQLFNNLASLGFENMEERIAKNKRHLKELLEQDTRGLIVTMIHKFEGMPQNINQRKNIFVLIDEAHRTTSGDLGTYLLASLPNATYIGFTGTPIDKTKYGKGTFKIFGINDSPKGYLDKYGIAESIEDGSTIKLHYSLAPNTLKPKKELLEKEFFKLAGTEGVSDIETLNKVLERAVNLKNFLKNKQRVKEVTEYVIEHFKSNVEPMGYKAFLVGVDREACVLYKEELDKHLPKEYSEVVFSPAHNDPQNLVKFHLTEEKEKRIRKLFVKSDRLPKILIVTEKLLTGFDAPILYCMYLDKPMRDHVLLQAIARVNRPYEQNNQKKPCGFVLDFIGIFDKLEKALAFDSGDISGIVKDIDVLKLRFKELINEAKANYLKLIEDKKSDKAVETILEYFRNDEKRHSFFEFFKEISNVYEIISPDAFLRPYLRDYDTIVRMYWKLKEAYEHNVIVDKEFTRKTARLVQEHIETGKIKPALDIYEINENTLKKLEESKVSETEKVFNLLRSIENTVLKNRLSKPYLISIGEKADLISKYYKQRQIDTQETLDDLKELIEETNLAEKERAKKKISNEAFSVYWVLRAEGIDKPEDKANLINSAIEKFPYWKDNSEYLTELKHEILKVFGNSGVSVKKSVELTNKLLKILRGD